MAVGMRTGFAVSLIAALALSGCGTSNEVSLPTAAPSGSIELPDPSLSVPDLTPSRTAEAPEPTRSAALPEPTRTADRPESQSPEAPEPTRTPETLPAASSSTPAPTETSSPAPTQETSAPPTETAVPTATVTLTQSATPTASETESPSASASATVSESAEADDGDGSAIPLWLGLAALAAAAGALVWFLIARSRRRDWDERLDVERTQGLWVANELIPALTNPAIPPEQVSQYWAGAQPSLNEIEASLSTLIDEAPDEDRSRLAQAIAQALTQVRSSAAAHVALVSSATADPGSLGASSAAVQNARIQLATALAAEV